MNSPDLIVSLAVALGCGLLIGVERERRKGTGAQRATAGLRTFTIASLAGALAQGSNQPALVALGGAFVLVLTAIGYWRDRSDDPGITTELALFVTYMLGVTAIDFPQLASATAVVVAILLAMRTRLHHFSTDVITTPELHSALVLAGSALVVLPLIPNQRLPWLGQINPRDLWRLTVVLMSLQAAGHIGLRLVGPWLGMAVAGLVSGFVSSTATIAAMGSKARENPALALTCLSGALASNIATILLIALIAYTADTAVIAELAWPLLAAGATVVASTALVLRQRAQTSVIELPQKVFGLRQTLAFAGLLTAISAVMAWLSDHAPSGARDLGAALAGFADVHAACAATFALSASHKITPAQTALPMLLALSTNSLSKLIGAFISGGMHFGLRVGSCLVAMVGSSWLAWALTA
jgi:uncharacterized membrane protein (DUF4010 family)